MSESRSEHERTPQQAGETDAHASPNFPVSAPQDAEAALELLRLHLRKRFLLLLLPPGLLLAGLESARALKAFDSLPYVDHPTWDVLLFVLAAVFALVLPLLYRVLFANAHRGKTAVAFGAFYRFENNSMVAALFSAWIAVGASLIAVTGYHMAGIFLLTLYASYVFYPSRRRLKADAKIFRAGFSKGITTGNNATDSSATDSGATDSGAADSNAADSVDPASRKAGPEASEPR